MLTFTTARFVASALEPHEFPDLKGSRTGPLPEIAVVGRANVGKSSLLNALFGQKLAKTSSTPGKTQRINFFVADEGLVIADLPGYGFSKAPKGVVDEWSQAIDCYLNTRSSLRAVLLLIDIRRGFNPQDVAMQKWAEAKRIPVVLIFTKRDKVSPLITTQMLRMNPGALIFSNVHAHDRHKLIEKINEVLA